ncbi:MAG: PorT family protein [Schleiferiaceae bacterium]|nr:PorT family protein [Schleiferiaceae bacterium]
MIQRRLLPLIVFVLAIASAYGQKTSTFIPEPGEGFSFNSSALLVSGAPEAFSPGAIANSQEIHFMRDNVFGISHFSWAWGVGYSAHFYQGNLHLDVSEDGTMTPVYLTGNDHSNRFATEYVDGTVELRYRGNVNKKGRYNRLYVGALFGYRTDSYSYYKDQNYRVKFYNIAGFNPYRYGVYAKAGRGPVNVFGFYGMSPLVVDGPLLDTWQEARSLNLGLSITL